MIEINLLPGGRKTRRGASGPRMDLGASLASLRERIREPWLIGGTSAVALAIAVMAILFLAQSRREANLGDSLQKAVQDSTRYASVLRERERAEARRDTVLRSLNLIRAIDDDRFIWPHVMDEVSSALPPYTWIVSLGFSGTGQATTAITTTGAPVTTSAPGRKRKALNTLIPLDTVRLRLVGNTVDIQALTRFIRQLEVSPYLEQVQLAKSERSTDNGKEVTQFQLDMMYSRPDTTLVRRVPLALSLR